MAVPQKIKHRIIYDPTIPLLGIYPKELKTQIQTNTFTQVFMAELFMLYTRDILQIQRHKLVEIKEWKRYTMQIITKEG